MTDDPAHTTNLAAAIDRYTELAQNDANRETKQITDAMRRLVETLPRYAYRFGDQQLNVHGPGSTPQPRAADPVRPGNSDLCFVWDGPIEAAVEYLERHAVEVELGPVERIGAGGRGTSVYFRDPDGSLLELISYTAA